MWINGNLRSTDEYLWWQRMEEWSEGASETRTTLNVDVTNANKWMKARKKINHKTCSMAELSLPLFHGQDGEKKGPLEQNQRTKMKTSRHVPTTRASGFGSLANTSIWRLEAILLILCGGNYFGLVYGIMPCISRIYFFVVFASLCLILENFVVFYSFPPFILKIIFMIYLCLCASNFNIMSIQSKIMWT